MPCSIKPSKLNNPPILERYQPILADKKQPRSHFGLIKKIFRLLCRILFDISLTTASVFMNVGMSFRHRFCRNFSFLYFVCMSFRPRLSYRGIAFYFSLPPNAIYYSHSLFSSPHHQNSNKITILLHFRKKSSTFVAHFGNVRNTGALPTTKQPTANIPKRYNKAHKPIKHKHISITKLQPPMTNSAFVN